MLLLFLLLQLVPLPALTKCINGLTDTTTSSSDTTDPLYTTTGPPDTTTGVYEAIYCDHFPEPSDVDEGNYGDMICYIQVDNREELILRKTLVNLGGQTFFQYIKRFPKLKVTRVSALNFGRYHGFTTAIGIAQEGCDSVVDAYINMDSGNEFRIFLEVYGYEIC